VNFNRPDRKTGKGREKTEGVKLIEEERCHASWRDVLLGKERDQREYERKQRKQEHKTCKGGNRRLRMEVTG